MLLRKAEQEILSWIQTSKTALLVSGARQVGKTWSIRNCLRAEGCDYLEINLIEEPELVPALAQCNSVSDLIVILSAVKNYSFTKGKTILFIDEVQELKEIVTKVKFWVDEGSFELLDSMETLTETRDLVAAMDCPGCVFRMNHASNYLMLGGTLNEDKEELLREIDAAIAGQVKLRPEWARGF